jgi:hypothetical protein
MLLQLYLHQNHGADLDRKQLAQIQKKDSNNNDRCCDCGAPSPQWVTHALSWSRAGLMDEMIGITQVRHIHMFDLCWHASIPRRARLFRQIDLDGRLQAE